MNEIEIVELTKDQIAYFKENGLKVPKFISLSLLGIADQLVLRLRPTYFYINTKMDYLFVFDFKEVIKKRGVNRRNP